MWANGFPAFDNVTLAQKTREVMVTGGQEVVSLMVHPKANGGE